MNLSINDIFFSRWRDLKANKAYRILFSTRHYETLHSSQEPLNESDKQIGGYHLLNCLKAAAKPRKWRLIKSLAPEQKVDIYHDPFFHTPFRDFFVKSIKTGRSSARLLAPDEALANLTFGHFKYADHEYSLLAIAMENQDLETMQIQVNRLIASIYVPEGHAFDKLKVHEISERVDRGVLLWQKELIVEAYANTRDALIRRCPTFWPQRDEEDPAAAGPSEATGPLWHNLHYDVAMKSEAFKGFDSVDEANLYDLIDYLEKEAKERKDND